jgi:hypothetical protein
VDGCGGSAVFLFRRYVNGREHAASIQDRQLTGIPPVGLDAIPHTPRSELARSRPTEWTGPRGRAAVRSRRPGFIAAADRALPPQPLDEAQNPRAVGRQRVERPASARRAVVPRPPSWPRADRRQ